MKTRHLVIALVALITGVAVWLAGGPGPAQSRRPLPAHAPVRTQTGEVIPAVHSTGGSINPPPDGFAAATGRDTPTPSPRLGARNNQLFAAMNTPAQAAALVEANKVRHMITDYHTLMGQNPVGTNAEIMRAVMGGNAHEATLGPPPGQSLNDRGELVDQWGTPYFFHQLSADRMEIYSAGPDRILGTADDIVVK